MSALLMEESDPMPTGRTTRLILEALKDLSSGFDVIVIAHPAAEAFRIADSLCEWAESFGIPCQLSEDNKGFERYGEVPLVMIRPFGWEPEFGPRWRSKPRLHVDHSAVFERPHVIPHAIRSVVTR